MLTSFLVKDGSIATLRIATEGEIDECVTSRLDNEPDFSDLLEQIYFRHVSNFEQIVVSLNDNLGLAG